MLPMTPKTAVFFRFTRDILTVRRGDSANLKTPWIASTKVLNSSKTKEIRWVDQDYYRIINSARW